MNAESSNPAGLSNQGNPQSKHTPGPWFLSGQYVQVDEHGGVIARVHGGNIDNANALLIAAAPELLEVCQMAASSIKVDPMALLEAARAAVKKATNP